MRLHGEYVKIDRDLLRNDVVARYSLYQMSSILGRGRTYLTCVCNGSRNKNGMLYSDLEKIAAILGTDVSKYTVNEETVVDETEQEPTEDLCINDPITMEKVAAPMFPDLTKVYEGIEMNGEGIGKLLEAVEKNTDAVKELMEVNNKLLVVVSEWTKKWCNQQKFGRF